MTTLQAELEFETLWNEAVPWSEFAVPSIKNWPLWDGIHRRAVVPQWALEAAARIAPLKLLVISEDWCGDAVNTIPILVRLAETAPGVELRILARDSHPAVMDRYLTDGTRSIPIVIGLDSLFRELGHWGPRPAALQDWVMAHKDAMSKDERYLEIRKWYARDKGETALRELFAAIGA